MPRLAFEAIIFDLDGTLIDTETADLRACELLYQEHGIALTPEYWADEALYDAKRKGKKRVETRPQAFLRGLIGG